MYSGKNPGSESEWSLVGAEHEHFTYIIVTTGNCGESRVFYLLYWLINFSFAEQSPACKSSTRKQHMCGGGSNASNTDFGFYLYGGNTLSPEIRW